MQLRRWCFTRLYSREWAEGRTIKCGLRSVSWAFAPESEACLAGGLPALKALLISYDLQNLWRSGKYFTDLGGDTFTEKVN